MGSELEQPPQGETQSTSLKDYFDELFAYAISIGMSYEQFWEDDVDLLVSYYKAEQIRIRKRNTELYLQGVYVYHAIGCLAPVLNGFSKDGRARPYLKHPIPITEEERVEENNRKVANFKAYMMSLVKGGKKDGGL